MMMISYNNETNRIESIYPSFSSELGVKGIESCEISTMKCHVIYITESIIHAKHVEIFKTCHYLQLLAADERSLFTFSLFV